MIKKTELQRLLDFSVELANGAGEIALKYFQRTPEVDTKADGSVVTIADREAEAFLRTAIARRFGDDAILGEEEGESKGTSGRRWILDPIDGTFAFVHGVPIFGVLIALQIDDEPILGVINLPALNEMVYAAQGIGCFHNGQRARVSDVQKAEDALLLCTDFSACQRYGFGPAATSLQQLCHSNRTWGDCYGHFLVATGRADIMLDPVMNLWDCAALKPIIEEAGGTFTDWNGRNTANGGNAISTNRVLFEEVMQVINAARSVENSDEALFHNVIVRTTLSEKA